ncbi:pyruvate ferredoxin oxidoreductase, partial [Candidatus Woesearchaeota archaeon CG_4_10_14_0_8_um_filter_47_5]
MQAKKIVEAKSGAECSAEAMRQINPDVVAAYPITPQTPVMHAFAQFVADGDVDTEFITVESEHSAMSATVGAAAAGVRAMTATAANGLALMHEIVYIAASMRLPIVMNVVNRALSGPINIHCDHSDTMGSRDSGWIQLYSESGQEAYYNTLLAVRLAEHPKILLPVMVCQDGFITSHSVERVELLEDKDARAFIGPFTPHNPLLDLEHPVTHGPLDLYNYYFEHKMQQSMAMKNVPEVYDQLQKELSKLIGYENYDVTEEYFLRDAEVAIVCMNSSAGTVKHVISELREEGKKVGLLKMRMFRPFPAEKVVSQLAHLTSCAVLDRAESFSNQGGPLFGEVRNSLYEAEKKPAITNYIYGLGGRE